MIKKTKYDMIEKVIVFLVGGFIEKDVVFWGWGAKTGNKKVYLIGKSSFFGCRNGDLKKTSFFGVGAKP